MMNAITNARNAVIAQNTVGVIKPFFLQCLDIDASATMQAGRGKEAQRDLQRTRIRTAPERQNAGTKLVFNAARARENWLLFGLIFYQCRGYCPARRPGVKVKAASNPSSKAGPVRGWGKWKNPEFARFFHFNRLPFRPIHLERTSNKAHEWQTQ